MKVVSTPRFFEKGVFVLIPWGHLVLQDAELEEIIKKPKTSPCAPE
ncbi:MAG: hypothetical protein ACI8PB_001702 [Desulforhopalus sp.]